jgi:hypothetical protein
MSLSVLLASFAGLLSGELAQADTRVIIPSGNDRSVIMIYDDFQADAFRLHLGLQVAEKRNGTTFTREIRTDDGKLAIECNWLLEPEESVHACVLRVIAGPDTLIRSGDRLIKYEVAGDRARKLFDLFNHPDRDAYRYETRDKRFRIEATAEKFLLQHSVAD